MPPLALANGYWCGPLPPCISTLTEAERLVIQLGRVYCYLRRVFLADAANMPDECKPWYHSGNVVAYPQDPTSVRSLLALMPEDLADTILVQFLDGHRRDLLQVQSLKVAVPKLRAAFAWLVRHNHLFLDATRAELLSVPGLKKDYDAQRGQRLEELLTA